MISLEKIHGLIHRETWWDNVGNGEWFATIEVMDRSGI